MTRDPVEIERMTWNIDRATGVFQGIEFRHHHVVRRVPMTDDELPSAEDFDALTFEQLEGLLHQAAPV